MAGLDLGADDYISDPSAQRARARISRILGRVGRGAASQDPREPVAGLGVIRLGDLVVDTNRRQVSRGGERIALTYTEFSLRQELLFREPGRVVPRAKFSSSCGVTLPDAQLIYASWMYVARLRGNEPDPRNPELILTVRGGVCLPAPW